MFRARSAVIAALVLIALAGCKKDKAVGPKPTDITGTWNATKVEYVSKAAPVTRVDLIAKGSKASMLLYSDKRFFFILTDPGMSPDTTTGVWEIDGDMFKVTPTGMPFNWEWNITLSGTTLTLTGADMEFDFNGDDVMEGADQNMTLVR